MRCLKTTIYRQKNMHQIFLSISFFLYNRSKYKPSNLRYFRDKTCLKDILLPNSFVQLSRTHWNHPPLVSSWFVKRMYHDVQQSWSSVICDSKPHISQIKHTTTEASHRPSFSVSFLLKPLFSRHACTPGFVSPQTFHPSEFFKLRSYIAR